MWYNFSYTIIMKTAISIPDNLFKNVEKAAKKLGISRSNLFSIAIQEYLENHNYSHITKKLDSIYSNETNELNSEINKMQIHTIIQKEDW